MAKRAMAVRAETGIENTTATAFGEPRLGILMAFPGAIEASERAGQAQLVASAQLPVKMQAQRKHFEALGFVFGAPTKGDRLFCAATLPAGWEKRGSDHAMWSYIHDDKGRCRVEVFYKAAFYDRDAFMRLADRYRICTEWSPDDRSIYVCVKDGETEIHRTETVTSETGVGYGESERLRTSAREWLAANRPGWNDPVKSWAE